MAKINYGTCVGTCAVCTINLWSSTKGRPVIWPCNVKHCPYETIEEQNKFKDLDMSFTGSGLAQIE
jgi:nitrate reductase beta subunit